MSYKVIDSVHERIIKKFEDGTFTMGKNCSLKKYYFSDMDISDFPISKRTPEVCVSLMDYSRCKLHDVPESSRTREFFLASFTNDDVYNYIKNNIQDFDRQFFKDLITTNEYATHFDRNCFAIMPLEYIDEEMCSLAILTTMGWSATAWFYSVYDRKPEALTADLWKLGARLYSRLSGNKNRFLSITPEEYKDEEYYKEMCMSNFNAGMELDDNKGKIMDSIPQDVITPSFVTDLLNNNVKNIARFNETALETEVKYQKDGKLISEKVWKYVVRVDGYLIRNIELNEERINFFLSLYDKDSSEYRWGLKDNYKEYKKTKNPGETLLRIKTIEEELEKTGITNFSFLPIKYRGIIPYEYSKTHDDEEYLEMMYNEMGIKVGEKYDRLFYRVVLPAEWKIKVNGYLNYVIDNDGNRVIEYFYDPKFYDREAYVKEINFIKEKQMMLTNK